MRVKDLEFERLEIIVRDAKGQKDRVTLLPKTLVEPLKLHLEVVRRRHEHAMQQGFGGVELPHALAKKYPSATYQWGWQYVFPSAKPGCAPPEADRPFSRTVKWV